jgi:hypothetical protein
MAITTPVYTTREIIKRALDQGEIARNNRNIDRCIESASRNTESLCHRIFYPRIATKNFDWPNNQRAVPGRLWLDQHDLISVTTLSSGGTVISSSNFNLEPNTDGPPYSRLELDTSTSASFGGGSTPQQDISITGLWGWNDEHMSVGTLTEALDSSETSIDVSASASADIGVGSILKIDSERMLVTDRTQIDTGINVGGAGLTANKNSVSLTVSDGTQFAVDEVLLIESERMLITEIAGNIITVERGFEGSVLAAHAAGVDIYAPRTLTVTRGALGSTAAAHNIGGAVTTWRVPPAVRQYATAEAIHELMQEQTGWFRTMSASSIFGGTAKRAATIEALVDYRDQLYQTHGRKARTRSI